MHTALYIIAGVVAAEAATFLLVNWLRQWCGWLITKRDLSPAINPEGLRRFIESGWDPELGWTRKPNTSKEERGAENRITRYSIGPDSARVNPGFENASPAILLYGDSYAFARQVNDNETWAHFLSQSLGQNVVNKGVGNFGFDQALLRLEREQPEKTVRTVVIAVVPETICRVLSVWKHFSEYGNTLAVKPRFDLRPDGLTLIENRIRTPDDFNRLDEHLSFFKEADFFYRRKFSRDMIRFPYLFHVLRNARRNLPLMAAALADKVTGSKDRMMNQIMRNNIRLTAALYSENGPTALLDALIERYRSFAQTHGVRPVLIFVPQLHDLIYIRRYGHYYQAFLERVRKGGLEVVDLAPVLLTRASDRLYVNDIFGGHLSVYGNRLVADALIPLFSSPQATDGYITNDGSDKAVPQ